MGVVSRAKSALWGSVASQIFTIISMLTAIVSTPMMVKYLDKEEYGLSILFYQIIGYLALFDFGLSTSVIRQLALHRGEDEQTQQTINRIMSTSFFVATFFGLVITVFGFFFAPFVPALFDLRPDLAGPAVPIVFTLSLMVGAQFMQRGLGGIFFAHHRQVLIGTTGFVITTLGIVITVGLLALGVGLWSFVYANIFQVVSNLLVQVLLLRRYYPHLRIAPRFYDRELLRTIFGFGFFMFLNGIATQIILYTDRLVIGKVVSLAAVSVFSITVRIPEVGMSLLAKILDNASPAITEIVAHEGAERAGLYFHRLMLLIVTLSITAFWLMLALNEWFIGLWVGADFFAGVPVLVLALLIMVQQTVVRTGSFFLSAKGVARPLSTSALLEAGLNITLSVLLGRMMGLTGVLLGTLLAACATSMWYIPYLLRKHIGISPADYWLRALLWPLLGVSAAGGGIFLLVRWLQALWPHSWPMFLLTGAVTGVLLGAFTWLVYLREPLRDYVPARFRRYLLIKA